MFSGDFVKLTTVPASAGISSDTDEWSDQEVLLLLEGVEMFEDDWTAIEEHVGTRSAHQCIRKFLELPIEDPYIEREAEGAMGALRYARVPFEKADNPVMSVVAFLAGVVTGDGAEKAKAALREMDGAQEKDGENQVDSEMRDESIEPTRPVAKREPSTTNTLPTVTEPSEKLTSQSRAHRAASLALTASAHAASALHTTEATAIRSTLSNLVKLTLQKLELKMQTFEEMEELLEDERRSLEIARLGLVSERQSIKRVLEGMKMSGGTGVGINMEGLAGGSQGTRAVPVAGDVSLQGEMGPVGEGTYQQLV